MLRIPGAAAVSFVLLLGGAACGDDGGGNAGPDAGPAGPGPDAAPEADAMPRPEHSPFRVVWSEDDGGQLWVEHEAAPDRRLWATRPGEPFVLAARGDASWGFNRGSFTIDDDIDERCEDSIVDDVVDSDDGFTTTVTGHFTDCTLGFELTFTYESQRQLRFALTLLDDTGAPTDAYNRTALSYASSAAERFYGFGAQYSHLDMKGRTLPIWSQEQGHGRGRQPITFLLNTVSKGSGGAWHTSYTGVPYYVSSERRGFALENYEYVEFDLERDDAVEVRTFAPSMAGRLLYGADLPEIVTAYTEYTGRMQPLPDWVGEGAIVRVHGGSDAVRAKLAELQAADVPIAALWIEDWSGKRQTITGTRLWWNWVVDRGRYPDWEALLAELVAADVRVMTYFNPYLADVSDKDDAERNLFEEARAAGYLVKNDAGEPYMFGAGGFDAAIIDLSSPMARAWIKDIMKEQIGLGVSGWMNDFGEALPPDAVLASGEDPTSYHNRFPEEWARVAREAADEAGSGDVVFFNRSGSARSPAHATLFWLGDQLVSWDEHDGIKTVVPGLISAGLSGYSLDHSDIGGYLSVNYPLVTLRRDAELHWRWAELAAFTAAYRTHHTNEPDANHQFDSDAGTLAHFSRMAKVFVALAPYREQLMVQARDAGLPLVRHLMLHFPDDPAVYGLERQFMLGADFLVAPVLDPDVTQLEVYLPAGQWVHLWSGNVFGSTGEWRTLPAPVGQPAVLYPEGSAAGAALRQALADLGLL